MLKLHVGCGKNFKEGYINIDGFPDKQWLKMAASFKLKYSTNIKTDIITALVWDLPYKNNSVDEVLSEHMMEHLSFVEEERTWKEIHRVLKFGGQFIFEVPDFEWIIKKWLDGQDNFKQFYALGKDHDYFGQGYDLNQRWGYLTAAIFGNQSNDGQFHKTAYTINKIHDIARLVGFKVINIEYNENKHHQNIRATLEKI